MSDEINEIVADEDHYRWYTRIPNIVDDLGLSPYAYRLYGHFRRVAGELGTCYQSTKTLADVCNMSAGSVTNAKTELAEAKLISITHEKRNGGTADVIRVVNIWKRNYEKFKTETRSPGEQPHSPGEQPRSPHERTRSPGETKKNTVRKTTKEQTTEGANAPAPSASWPMISAIASICGQDPKIKSVAAKCGRVAKELAAVEATPEQVQKFNRWARLNWWRCKKDGALDPLDLPANWKHAMDWNGSVRMANERPAPIIDMDYLAELEQRKGAA